jgi:hypothetical protein
MRLSMSTRRELSRATAARYRQAGRVEKGRILDEFCQLSGYHRCYASSLLRNYGRQRIVHSPAGATKLVPVKSKAKPRGRPRTYGAEVAEALAAVWARFDFLCGKRLAVFLPTVLPLMQRHGEWRWDSAIYQQLLRISASTIDRILKAEKATLELKGRSLTRPARLLLHQVPVRTWSEWEQVNEPGHLLMDLVGHDGGNSRGKFAFTLTVTDHLCEWTERRAVKNRAQRWVFEALQDIRQALPFPVSSLHSDSGGEFINHNLIRYCAQQHIRFTRSRSARKNDNCWVEQKNFDAVRKVVGYLRYDTEEELQILNRIYRLHGLLLNYLYPSQRLISKTRRGSKLTKKHDPPRSPYQRLLASSAISSGLKTKLRVHYYRIHPGEISNQIAQLQDQLLSIAKRKKYPSSADKVVNQ